MKSARKIYIFDTTLRDGEQSPGASLTPEEKLKIAKQLERLNVDVIEAGFPASSEGEMKAVSLVAEQVKKPVICGLSRMVPKDIDACRRALEKAAKKRLHVFLATSQIHRDFKLKKNKREIIEMAVKNIRSAKKDFRQIEFSPEDASRTERDFLAQVVRAAIDAGATSINIPDTVGYTVPQEFSELMRFLIKKNPELGKTVVLSVHCHNDLGLATANSLAAILAGANQVECTVNAIGERAGNASMEEIVMTIDTRKDLMNCYTDIKLSEITKTSRLVSHLTGMVVQPNRAIVGRNAFWHALRDPSGRFPEKRQTYEIMNPKNRTFRKPADAGQAFRQARVRGAYKNSDSICPRKKWMMLLPSLKRWRTRKVYFRRRSRSDFKTRCFKFRGMEACFDEGGSGNGTKSSATVRLFSSRTSQ